MPGAAKTPPRREPDVARGQNTALALTTAVRIRRYAEQVIADISAGRPVAVHAHQVIVAATTLYGELVAIAVRDEIAARGSAAA